MAEQCSPQDIQKVEAILEAVDVLDRDKLKRNIKECARQTDLGEAKLTSIIEKISDISVEQLQQAPATSGLPPPASGQPSGTGAAGSGVEQAAARIQSMVRGRAAAARAATAGGGKRKSKKNKSKNNKSKKNKSKKRRSKRRKYRKIRRTRR